MAIEWQLFLQIPYQLRFCLLGATSPQHSPRPPTRYTTMAFDELNRRQRDIAARRRKGAGRKKFSLLLAPMVVRRGGRYDAYGRSRWCAAMSLGEFINRCGRPGLAAITTY